MAGSRISSSLGRLFAGLLPCALTVCAVALCTLVAAAPAGAVTGGSGPRQTTCPVLPGNLTATGGAAGFTMLIRVNNQANVNAYTNGNSGTGGLGGHIRAQDVFVINTRFQNTTATSNPTVASDLATQLRTAFPCNRIITLNGLGIDPTQPGFIYALNQAPAGIYAMLLDWELTDWAEAQATGAPLLPWTYSYIPNRQRVNTTMLELSNVLANSAPNNYARAGLVPFDSPSWNYGELAQKIDRGNARLGYPHLGLQSIMTQSACMAGGTAFSNRTKAIMDQYRFRIKIKKKKVRRHGKIVKKKIMKKVKIKKAKRPNLNNLALQISFSATPDPADPLPIRNVSATTADACVAAGLARGAAAFFFFANDDAMSILFTQPTMASLRPATS